MDKERVPKGILNVPQNGDESFLYDKAKNPTTTETATHNVLLLGRHPSPTNPKQNPVLSEGS